MVGIWIVLGVFLTGVFVVVANALEAYVVINRMRQVMLLKRYCRLSGGIPRTLSIGDNALTHAALLANLLGVLVYVAIWLAFYVGIAYCYYTCNHVGETQVLALFAVSSIPNLLVFTLAAIPVLVISLILMRYKKEPEIMCLSK